MILVAVCAAAGLDPVTQVFAWMSGTATLGALLLMGLTCLSVIVFFRRTRLDRRPWQTLLAPGLGLLGLCLCLWLVATNFPLLIGGSTALAVTIGALPPTLFAIGAVLALVRSRRTEPATSAQPVPMPVNEAV